MYSGGRYDFWAVRIDSLSTKDGITHYYGFHSNRLLSHSGGPGPFGQYCVDPYGPSRMGAILSIGASGNIFMNLAGDPINIQTDLPPGISWFCCKISDSTHLDAIITLAQIDTVLGMADSVKYIAFQARRNTGDSISHPLNNKLFKLSKRIGMISLFDFSKFPSYDSLSYPVHQLAGIKAPGMKLGVQNLTSRDIYSMAPGDEFHIVKAPVTYFFGQGLSTVKIVLDSTWNRSGDTVQYRSSRLMDFWPGPGEQHQYSRDTILETWAIPEDESSPVDNLPEKTIFSMKSPDTIDYTTSYSQYRSSNYNYRRMKQTNDSYTPCSFCADTLVGMDFGYIHLTTTNIYIEGCGSGYYEKLWTDGIYTNYGSNNYLQYFKKGTETWGTPLDTTDWNVPYSLKENNKLSNVFKVFPNPTSDQITIYFPGIKQGKCHFELYSLPGTIVLESGLKDQQTRISLGRLSKGMYIFKLLNDNNLIVQQKIILE